MANDDKPELHVREICAEGEMFEIDSDGERKRLLLLNPPPKPTTELINIVAVLVHTNAPGQVATDVAFTLPLTIEGRSLCVHGHFSVHVVEDGDTKH